MRGGVSKLLGSTSPLAAIESQNPPSDRRVLISLQPNSLLFILAHFVKTAIPLVFRAVVSFHSGGMLATRHAARSKHDPNRLVAEGHAQMVGAAA